MSDSALFTVFMTLGLGMLYTDCQLTKWRRHQIYVECYAKSGNQDDCSEAAKKAE